MQDKFFEISRTNMVQNQIITNKVVSENIINAFLTIEKEKFIPESHHPLVYSDSSIEIKKLIYYVFKFSGVAQLVEQATVNRFVTGSSPVAGAILLFIVKINGS